MTPPRDTYEVHNPEIEARLKDIGGLLKDAMTPGWGFALFIFNYQKAKRGELKC